MLINALMGIIIWGWSNKANAESPCSCEYTVDAWIEPQLDCLKWYSYEGGCSELAEIEDWTSHLTNQCDTPIIIDCTEYSMNCVQNSEACEFSFYLPELVGDMAGQSAQIEPEERIVWAFDIPDPRIDSVMAEYLCNIVKNEEQYSLELYGSFWCNYDQSPECEYPEDAEQTSTPETSATFEEEIPKSSCSSFPKADEDPVWMVLWIGLLGWTFQTYRSQNARSTESNEDRNQYKEQN